MEVRVLRERKGEGAEESNVYDEWHCLHSNFWLIYFNNVVFFEINAKDDQNLSNNFKIKKKKEKHNSRKSKI